MVLHALSHYYDILLENPESGIASPGYSSTGVSFALNLSAEGELLNIFPLFEKVLRGKKYVEIPLRMVIPEQVKRSSGISANFLCDNSAYVLGLSSKNTDDPGFAIRRFEAFRHFNISLLQKASCPEARAVIAFLDRYKPQEDSTHLVIRDWLDRILEGGNIIFKLNGSPGFAHEAARIQQAWEEYKVGSANAYIGQCLVTGEMAPIAVLHPSLKGIRDANPTGATLVGFNARAYESYNRLGGQGLNSPVSEKVAFRYTTALNFLLSSQDKHHKFILGDTTVVYWAESPLTTYAEIIHGMFAPDEDETGENEEKSLPSRDQRADQLLREIAIKIQQAQSFDQKMLVGELGELDLSTRFYVLGLAPNAARIAVRFFHRDPFDKVVSKLMEHYQDLHIVKEFDNQPTLIAVWKILKETVSDKSSDKKASPLMAGAVFSSILTGTSYPAALYYAILNRIRADMDGKGVQKINYVRAAIIKAYLIRKYRNQPKNHFQEVLVMSLNENSTIPAYVLGRLFAVLEKVQQEAIGDVNASIKDRYFTSACASPASVFPVLLRLSQHHISKAAYGYVSDRRIQEILSLLDVERNPIPARLTLDEQGIFVLGYYHQRAAFYVSRNDPIEKTNGSAA